MPAEKSCPLCHPFLGVPHWRLSDGVVVLEGHIASCGTWGVEYRLLFDGLCRFTQRFTTHEEALGALTARRVEYLESGWIPVAATA